MMFRKLFRYEFRYQLQYVSTWLLLAFFLLFGFIVLRIVTLADGAYLNAPGTIAFFTVFGSAIWVVIGGVVAGDAATRDLQTRMHPLLYTTPVSKFSYLGARLMAALSLNATILLMLYLGFILSLYAPGAKSQFVGPFRLAAFLTSYTFLALPTITATTAIQFTFATLSGRAIASYLASIGILIFSQFGGTTVRYALEWKELGSLMDLLGTSIVMEMEGWTPIDKNTRLIQLEGTWLWNRIAWLGLTAGILTFAYVRFRMIHVTPTASWKLFNSWRKPGAASLADANSEDYSRVEVPAAPRYFSLKTYWRQAFAIARTSFRTLALSRGGLSLVAILSVGTGLFATEYMEWLGVPLLARTEEVLRVLTPPLGSYQTQWIIIPLLTIFYAGELLWREREAGLHELTDTTPVPEWVLFTGKFGGLALLILIWVVFLMLAGLINQLVMGYYAFEMGVYVKALFGIQLTNYLLFALLVFAIHVLVNHKYIGHMVAFGAYGFILFAPRLGFEHKLLVYASDTGWSYSDMRGFGPFIKPWLWFKLYWIAWALLLAVAATLLWVRTKEGGVNTRLHLAHRRLKRHKPVLLIVLGLIAGSGGYIFYNTNLRNEYLNRVDRMTLRADYERRYARYANATRPILARTQLHVEIYPDEQSADLQVTYQLVNRSLVAIDSIHLSTVPFVGMTAVSFDRAASAVVLDDRLGYRIYALNNPLRPGESVRLGFRIQIKPDGFTNEGVDVSVVANGSHIDSNEWMPVIGYDDDRRLRSAPDRERFGLPPRPERPSLYDLSARHNTRHAELMNFEAVVGTAKDQIAVAPGALRRSWTNGGRQYFHYKATNPIINEYAFFSARYALREARWVSQSPNSQPVTIQLFYHPAHNVNIERMMKSAQASLAYYAQEFGPYRYSHFRVLERPGPGRGMHAEPMTIDYQEGYSLMNPKPGGLDLPYHIMAHEVAHQWWGITFAAAAVEGAGVLIESFATYSAMQVVEKTLGHEHLLRYLTQMRQEYEMPRSQAVPPLLRANNSFLNYRKGPFALFALRNYIGIDRVNDALRRLLRNYTPKPPLPTTLDLYRELRAVTPDSLHYLVHDLFAANTFWELKTEGATTKQTKTGAWQVTLEVNARKLTVDSIGRATNIPMDDWVEFGVFAPAKKGGQSDKPLYLQKHHVRSGKQTLTVMVPHKPTRAGIDPNHLLIDLEMEDNVKQIEN